RFPPSPDRRRRAPWNGATPPGPSRNTGNSGCDADNPWRPLRGSGRGWGCCVRGRPWGKCRDLGAMRQVPALLEHLVTLARLIGPPAGRTWQVPAGLWFKYDFEGFRMIKVKLRGNETAEQMLRRFKKMCEKEGLTKDIKRIAYYEKPSEKRRRRRKPQSR